MNNVEFDSQMAAAREEYVNKRSKLRVDYVQSNTTVKMDDIVEDHIGSIIVERAGIHVPLTGYPEPRFYGLCLKKDGTFRKDKSKRWVHYRNML